MSVPVYTREQLAEELRAFVALDSRMVIVSVPAGPTLFVGLGGIAAGVSVYQDINQTDGHYESWTAAAKTLYAEKLKEFVSEGEPREFEAISLMPPEEVIQIAISVVDCRILPETHTWLNAQGEQYTPVHSKPNGDQDRPEVSIDDCPF